MKKAAFILIIIFSVINAGCGGGGSGGINPIDPTNPGQANKVLGYGAIVESKSNVGASSMSSLITNLSLNQKYLKVFPAVFPSKTIPAGINRSFMLQSIDPADLTKNIAFFYLTWKPSSEVFYYQIYYLGTDGAMNEMVWDSDDAHLEGSHPEDPPVYDTTTGEFKAYLDLDHELAEFLYAAGTYRFRVVGYDAAGNQVKEFPVITLSIGLELDDYPNLLSLITGGTQLSWTEVNGADGYWVGIYNNNDAALSNPIWQSGAALLPPYKTSIDISSVGILKLGFSYHWSVIAYALDNTGWPIEITRGIGDFDIK